MSRAFIQLDRDIFDAYNWPSKMARNLYAFMLPLARYQDGDQDGHFLARGQLRTTLAILTDELCQDTDKPIRTALAKLEAIGEITIKRSNKGTTITLVNYDFFTLASDNRSSGILPPVKTRSNQSQTKVKPEVTQWSNDSESQDDESKEFFSVIHNQGSYESQVESQAAVKPKSNALYNDKTIKQLNKSPPTPPRGNEEGFEFREESLEQRRLEASARGIVWDGYGKRLLENHNAITAPLKFGAEELGCCRAIVKKLVEREGMTPEEAITHCAEVVKWRAWMAKTLTLLSLSPRSIYRNSTVFAEGSAKVLATGGRFVPPQDRKSVVEVSRYDRPQFKPFYCIHKDFNHASREEQQQCGSCTPRRAAESVALANLKHIQNILNKVTEH